MNLNLVNKVKGSPSSEGDFLVHWPENPVSYLKLSHLSRQPLLFFPFPRIKSDSLNCFSLPSKAIHIHCRKRRNHKLTKRQNIPIQNPSLEATFKTLCIFLSKMRGYYTYCFITHFFTACIERITVYHYFPVTGQYFIQTYHDLFNQSPIINYVVMNI